MKYGRYTLTVLYYDRDLDDRIRKIVGRSDLGCGTFLPTGERDMTFSFGQRTAALNAAVAATVASEFARVCSPRAEGSCVFAALIAVMTGSSVGGR